MTKEVMVFHSEYHRYEEWRDALWKQLPELDVIRSADKPDPELVRYALVWRPPARFFDPFHNLGLVVNLGAGVDALIGRDDLPDAPITRISDPEMARMMAGYVLFAVLRYARDMPALEAAQREGRWNFIYQREAREVAVGMLGLGQLGSTAAVELARQGFDVRGWSRTAKDIPGVRCTHGEDALGAFLSDVEILVILLPLTSATRGIIDARRLAQLPAGAKLINPSRGFIVDEAALIAALQSGHLGAATIDAFEREPLPADSPLWKMPNVLITPHLASRPIAHSSAAQIAENIRRIRRGEAVLHRADPARGY